MRIVKDADERKNEILDVASTLFALKGFDKTTISDIIDQIGVARGTVYYYFKSKEEIMDALIERHGEELVENAKKIAEDKSIPVLERLFRTLMVMHETDTTDIDDDLHKPQNALMHQKTELLIIRKAPQVLVEIIKDGIEEGLFETSYPYETLEMVLAHSSIVFDSLYWNELPEQEQIIRIKAFIFNLERLFGAQAGTFEPVSDMFR